MTDEYDAQVSQDPILDSDDMDDNQEQNAFLEGEDVIPLEPYPDNPAHLNIKSLDGKQLDATLFNDIIAREESFHLDVYKFFGCEPVTHDISTTALRANILRYAIYKLQQTKQLELYGFNPSATLTSLVIDGDGTKVAVPSSGKYVVIIDDKLSVMDIHIYQGGHASFTIYAKEYNTGNYIASKLDKAMKAHNFYKDKVFTADGEFLKISKTLTLDDIILHENVAKEINDNVVKFFSHTRHVLRRHKLPVRRGLIFEGLPGVGKTYVSRALAATLGITFMVVTKIRYPEDVKRYFDFMRDMGGGLILFEDIDIYLTSREASKDDRLAALLNEMQGITDNADLVCILTTNRLISLDDAITKRPGRVDRILTFELPNKPLIRSMLELFCKNVDVTEVDLDMVADQCVENKFTGAHIQEIVNTSCINLADECVGAEDVLKLSTTGMCEAIKTVTSQQKKEGTLGFKR